MGANKATKNVHLPTNLQINNTELELVSSYKYLGLILNPDLTLTNNTSKTIGLLSAKLNTLTNIKKYVCTNTQLTLYKMPILPIFEYSNVTHSLISKTQIKKLQRLQNRALKLIFNYTPGTALEDLHIRARLAPIVQKVDRQLVCLMYRRSLETDKYPQVLSYTATRANEQIRFALPRPNSEKFKKFSMYKETQLWNNLPASTQKLQTYDLFKIGIPKAANFDSYPITG